MNISFFDFVGIKEINTLLEHENDLEDTFKNEVNWFYETSEIEKIVDGKISIYKEKNGGNVFVKYENQLIGGYCESILWIDPDHRGKNLGYILIDAAAKARNNVLNSESFTYAGLMLHLKYYINKFDKDNDSNIKDAKNLMNDVDKLPEKSFFDMN